MEKWYVCGKTCEEIYGVPEERDVKVGPFDTEAEAWREMESMDAERWISGQHVYYGTYVTKETVDKKSERVFTTPIVEQRIPGDEDFREIEPPIMIGKK